MKKLFSIAICAALLLSCTTAYACTIISASDGDNVLAGNNEDWYDKDTYVWFLPTEEGKYGRMFFGFEDGSPTGGVNEYGLFFDFTLDYATSIPVPNDEGKPVYDGLIYEYIMETCRTVDEALRVFDSHHVTALGSCTFFFADSSGDSATITYNRDIKQIEVKRKSGFYQVQGYGREVVKRLLNSSEGEISAELFMAALKAAQQDDITLFSNIHDLKTGDIYLYNQHNYDECVQMNIHEELKKGKHMYYIPSLFSGQKPGTYDMYKPQDMIDDAAEPVVLAFTIICALSLAVTVFVYIPVALLKRKAPRYEFFKPRFSIFAHAAGAANAALSLWLTGTLWFHGPFIVKYGMDIYSQAGAYVPLLIIALLLSQAAFTVITWCKKYWPVAARIHYTVFTASMSFAVFMILKTNILLP